MNNESKKQYDWRPFTFFELKTEYKKSSLKVSDASETGLYLFFTSGENILFYDSYQVDGDNLFLATGGNAGVKYYSGKASYSSDTWAITASGNIKALFLYYLILNEINFINYNYFQGSGLKHLQKRDLCAHLFNIPINHFEQQKIAEILGKVDESIEQTEALIAKYQRIKSGIMQDLLTKGLDANGNIRSEETHEFKDSPLGRIPAEWDFSKLKAVINFVSDYRGKTPPYSDSGIPVISAETLKNGVLKPSTKFVTKEIFKIWLTREIPKPGDVIFTTEAPVGEVAVFPHNGDFLLTRRVIAINFNSDMLNSRFGYWQFLKFKMDNLWNRFVIGSTVPRILKSDILNQFVCVPKPTEQNKIAALLEMQDDMISLEKEKWRKLLNLKAGLMQDLLSGKVRVTSLLREKA